MPHEGVSKTRGPALVSSKIPGKSFGVENEEDFAAEWCRQLLRDPAYKEVDFWSRKMSHASDSAYNTLMGRTLFTDQTFRAIKLLYKAGKSRSGKTANSASKQSEIGLDDELVALISAGGGMCSHSSTLHGGINTVLVDEVGGALASQLVPDPMMAVNFNVNLGKPVRTPGLILGRAWVDRRPVGRKVWIKVRLEQDGQTCIEAENLYLKMAPQGKL